MEEMGKLSAEMGKVEPKVEACAAIPSSSQQRLNSREVKQGIGGVLGKAVPSSAGLGHSV
jgi:hypothetical protein